LAEAKGPLCGVFLQLRLMWVKAHTEQGVLGAVARLGEPGQFLEVEPTGAANCREPAIWTSEETPSLSCSSHSDVKFGRESFKTCWS